MKKPSLLLITILIIGLTGCAVARPDKTENDINALVPPAAAADQFAPPAQTGPQATVRLQPASDQIELGTTTAIEIRLDNVTNLIAVDIELRFDPAILQVLDTDPNKPGVQIQPGDFLQANFVVTNDADNTTGVVRYVITQVGEAPANGNGLLASVPFLGIGPGSSNLNFSIVKLANADAQPIETVSQPGQVNVTQAGGGEPTETVTVIPITPLPTDTPAQPTPTFTPLPLATPTQPPILPTDTPVPPQPTLTPVPITATPVPPDIVCTPVPKGPTPDPNLCPPPPAPPPTTAPVAGTLGFCYQVQFGETIYSLAEKFGTSVQALNVVNDLYPPNMVYANMAIFIPTQLGNGPNFYQVQTGDTLDRISSVCRINARMIARINNLPPGVGLEPGQILEIPIPPYPPPARFTYPLGPVPVIPPPVAPFSAPYPPPHR